MSDFTFGVVTGLAVGLSSREPRVGLQAMTVGILAVAAALAVIREVSLGLRDPLDIEGIASILVLWGLNVVVLMIPIAFGFGVGVLVRTLIRPNSVNS